VRNAGRELREGVRREKMIGREEGISWERGKKN